MALLPTVDSSELELDLPRTLQPGSTRADRVFRVVLGACGSTVLLILGSIVVYLINYSRPAFRRTGLHLFTSSHWAPPVYFGVLGALVGSMVIAVLALAIALPVSLCLGLMINEYAPQWLRRVLISLVDLLATVPSVVYGFWGLEALTVYVNGPAKFLDTHFNFIPLFRTPEPGVYGYSIFVCSLIVGVMIIPIITSISREVMARAPREACEGALALGGTRWGMITDVILPYSRNGIVGASLLGLGRAIGETFAVYLILSTTNTLTPDILGPNGLGSISYLITNNFTSSASIVKSALTEAGLLLFATTLAVNLIARGIVDRAGGSTA